MKMKLNKRAIDRATYQGPGADYRWDTSMPAFGLRVYPSGQKSFVITYRCNGRQRFLTLARYGNKTLDEAQTLAHKALGRARDGEDPAADRLGERRAPTMTDLRDRFIEEYATKKMKPSSLTKTRRLWKTQILPRLGARKVAHIARADIAEFHDAMAGTPTQANHTRGILNTAFNLAEVWGWRPEGTNPCRHVKKYKLEARERFLSETELGRLADALTQAEQEHPGWTRPVAAVRLLILTGCRKGEILKLKWDEVEFDTRCLRLGDSKTGPKMVYLNTAALEVLAGIERVKEHPYVFPGLKPGTPLTRVLDLWDWIRDRANLPGVRVHDLRHTFASVGVGAGLNLPVLGRLLGHSRTATTDRYAHLADDPVRKAAETIGATLDAAMKRKPKAEVRSIDDRRPTTTSEAG
jgi:integrase